MIYLDNNSAIPDFANSLNTNIKKAIENRLKLANITGIFEDNREYANVLGALVYLKDKIT